MEDRVLVHMILSTQRSLKSYERKVFWTSYDNIWHNCSKTLFKIEQTNKLTHKAKHRLKVVDWYRKHRKNVSLTAHHFGLTRYTVRTWVKRFNNKGILGLNDKSHRPNHLRQPTTPGSTVVKVVNLRKQYPAWSKYKIQAILKKQGIEVSASTVGRILKRRNLIDKKVSKKRKKAVFSPKPRFPRGLRVSQPGDIIQMDTKHIMLFGGKRFYQFTAIDVLTKIRVLEVYPSESSRNGVRFLKYCLKTFPFPIRAVQTDNGSPFLKEFQIYCQKSNILHYFIYPRQPKQNTYVEISHQADEREFYLQGNVCSFIDIMRKKIKEWQNTWNTLRPHQSLNYLTPHEYLNKWQKGQLPTRDTTTLQT